MTQVAHRPKSNRAERRRAERRRAHRKPRRSWIPIAAIVGVIVAAGVIAVVTTSGSGTSTKGVHEIAKVSVQGSALPAPASPDKAVGMRAPVASGISFAGGSVKVPVSGKPTVVAFLAHWCPHCQKDVKEIQAWLDKNGMPSDIAIQTVSTWVDSTKPNYPPSTWLKNEGWTPEVLVDDAEGSVAAAYGLSATPMWVFIGADGVVKFRSEGEMTGQQLAQALDRLRAS
ncbi:MAG: TlpA family protein disulfide reductase [Actinomycetota bacterium]